MVSLIRTSTFETNSSSCHTLVLLKKPELDPKLSQLTYLDLQLRGFSWYEELCTVEEKMEYMLAWLISCDVEHRSLKDFYAKFKAIFPCVEKIYLNDKGYEVDEVFTMIERNHFEDNHDIYIDHESTGLGSRIIRSNKLEALFDPNSVLYCWSDSTDLSLDTQELNRLGISNNELLEIKREDYYADEEDDLGCLSDILSERIRDLGGVVL